MPSYANGEQRDWFRNELHGVANVIIPTFTSDLRTINEAVVLRALSELPRIVEDVESTAFWDACARASCSLSVAPCAGGRAPAAADLRGDVGASRRRGDRPRVGARSPSG